MFTPQRRFSRRGSLTANVWAANSNACSNSTWRPTLRLLAVVDCLSELLLKRGRQIVTASSLDQPSLDEAAEQVEKQIAARFGLEQRGAA